MLVTWLENLKKEKDARCGLKYYQKNYFLKKKKNYGRNNTGKITVRHRGGSKHKPTARLIDYSRAIWNLPAMVLNLERNFNNSANIALVVYPTGILSYLLAPIGLKPGQKVLAGHHLSPKPGYHTVLKHIPLNYKIHNIEAFPGSGGKYIRSAGTWAKIIEKNPLFALVLLSSGKKKIFNINCSATFGRLSNLNYIKKKKKRKAGDSRKLNIRPSVRGVAMNAVDHPHGGGKGKKSPKNPNYNFSRLLIKGKKTASIK